MIVRTKDASVCRVLLPVFLYISLQSALVGATPIDNGLIDSELVKECLTNNTVDVVILLDGSGSIGDDTFQLQLNFAGHLARRLNVSSTGSHLAIVQFAETPQLETSLNQFTNPNQLESAIRRIRYLSGATNTGQALHFALENGFQGARGGSVPKVVIVVTDGQSQDDVAEPAQRLRDSQALLYAIGVTNLVNVHQLHQKANLRLNVSETAIRECSSVNTHPQMFHPQLSVLKRHIRKFISAKGPNQFSEFNELLNKLSLAKCYFRKLDFNNDCLKD